MPIMSNPHGLFFKLKQKSWKNFEEVKINKIYTEKGKKEDNYVSLRFE